MNIYVHPSIEWLGRDVMNVLSRLARVQFKSCPHLAECRPGDTVLSLSGDDQALAEMSKFQLRYFHVSHTTCVRRSENQGEPVQFTKSRNVDKLLRGRTISHQALSNLTAIGLESGDEVLARYGECPVWVIRRSGDLPAHIVSAPLPKLEGSEKPFDYLNGEHFIQLLPLLHFLREVTAGAGWVLPPLRACFMFDDPNLHWPSYGFLSYRELIQQARKYKFHVAIATVPLDVWGPHSRTINLFKENTEYLSLLIHGNDHTANELGQPRTRDGHLGLVAQSLRRVERLERASGLHVDRVMVPPHEALVDSVSAAMLSVGFEGVCLSPWSLRDWDPKRKWPSTFCLEPAEMKQEGFPALARYRLSDSSEGAIVISAYLGNPIVLSEHHTGVAGGLDLLSSVARVVNSLDDVRWCSTETMLRSNFLQRQDKATLWLKPYSCRVELRVPDCIGSVALRAAEETDEGGAGRFSWIVKRLGEQTPADVVCAGVPFSVVPGETIELVSSSLGTVDYRQLKTPGFSVWALSRRVLCEGRDRLRVLRPRTR
jgi:hypothetical protein